LEIMQRPDLDVFGWIERELRPQACTSDELIYEDMESQSLRSLPIIYQPFDLNNRLHWDDRGALFDYLLSTSPRRILDFGPGDGWPSLIVAPFVEEVVGVDSSARRVHVCTENAKRLGITNASFVHVSPGEPLPFPDDSFDGVMAASSVEQTPDPKSTLRELFRILRPGGRLRIAYEALSQYRGGRERETWLVRIGDHSCRLLLYDRHIEEEFVRWYGITFSMSDDELARILSAEGDSIPFERVTVSALEQARRSVTEARVCTLTHPSGGTLVSWLKEIGFREVLPSHAGRRFASELFDRMAEEQRPRNLESLDELLRPLVEIVIRMPAPVEVDPMITAVE
jgi:SAM-dependent methyltransferase